MSSTIVPGLLLGLELTQRTVYPGSILGKRPTVDRQFDTAYNRLIKDYVLCYARYSTASFERQFRVTRSVFDLSFQLSTEVVFFPSKRCHTETMNIYYISSIFKDLDVGVWRSGGCNRGIPTYLGGHNTIIGKGACKEYCIQRFEGIPSRTYRRGS